MNWGLRIIILYSCFVIFMLGLVYKCTQQKFDLVASDYYQQELAYQKVIDGNINKAQLSESVVVNETTDAILVSLPASQEGFSNGTLTCYRPSDASKDIVLTMSGIQTNVSKAKLTKGLYKIRLNWEKNGKQYFDEQSVYVQ